MFVRSIALVLIGPLLLIAAEPRVDTLGDPLPAGAVARFGTMRLRTGDISGSLVFSPDGKQVASWQGESLSIWDAGTGKELRHLDRPGDRLEAWAWPAGGRGVAIVLHRNGEDDEGRSFGLDFTAEKVDPHDFGERDPQGRLMRFAISEAGTLMAVSHYHQEGGDTIELREIIASKPPGESKVLRTCRSELQFVYHLCFTPDGRTLVAISPTDKLGPNGRVAVLWDVASGKERRRLMLPGHAGFAVSNQQLAVAHNDGDVRLFDLATGREELRRGLHVRSTGDLFEEVVGAIAFSRDGKTLVTAGTDGAIRQWNVADGKKQREFKSPDRLAARIVFSPDEKTLAIGGESRTIHLIDAESGAARHAPVGHGNRLVFVRVSADGRTAVTGALDESLRVWDVATGRERRRIAAGGVPFGGMLTPDGRTIVAQIVQPDSIDTAPLQRWTLADGRDASTAEDARPVRSARTSADGRTLAVTRGDKAEIRDWPSGALRREIALPAPNKAGHESRGSIVALSPDGKWLVTSTDFGEGNDLFFRRDGGRMDLWDAASGRLVRQLGFEDRFARGYFTPAGELLIASRQRFGASQRVNGVQPYYFAVLNSSTGRLLRELGTPPIGIPEAGFAGAALAPSADGRTAYLGTANGVTVCELSTGGVRFKLAGHRAAVIDLAVHSGTRRLISASEDTTALVWDASLPTVEAPRDLDAPWNDLKSPDATKAYRAMASLAAQPRAVSFIAEHLPLAGPGPDEATLDKLVAELDSADFAKREKAEAELDRVGELASDGIRARLAKAKTTEAGRRLKRVVERLESPTLLPDRLREIRAVELLEYLDTPDAWEVLKKIAKGNLSARFTQDAARALKRVGD